MPNDYCGKCQNQGTKKCDGCCCGPYSKPSNWEPIKTPWQQATKELLEGDTRTEEEGNGYWWVLYKGDVFHYNAIHHLEFIRITMAEGPEINGLVYFNTITGTVYFDLEDIKIQPTTAPPESGE